jgi:subtilisin family serine protease
MTFADPAAGRAAYDDQQALARIRAPQARARGRGGGVIVGVLDTGVAAGHRLLAGRIAAGGADLVDGDANPADEAGRRDSDGDGIVDEAVGHGTFVAGLILSVAPDARILPIRVLDADGVGTEYGVLRGIKLAHARGARVINMSFGMRPNSGVIDGVIGRLRDEGVVFVASAGNDASPEQQFPAQDSHVIGVAATNPTDRKASFSNFGSWVDVAAPGVGLVSSFPASGFSRWSGTSFSSALVSGAAAVLLSIRPGTDADKIADAIEDGAAPLDLNGTDLGAGRLDVVSAIDELLR